MGKGERGQGDQSTYTWEEVKQHSSRTDKWVVIEDGVYDVSEWVKRHPGGHKVLSHYAGEDATAAFTAFHPDKTLVRKFMKPLYVGSLAADQTSKPAIVKDMQELRQRAEQMDLFRPSKLFYWIHFIHCLMIDVAAWLVLWHFGVGWVPYTVAAVLLATAQVQLGWFQHDLGHLSVFKKSSWNHLLHGFIIGGLSGSSGHWWNYRHFQHHAKPNIVKKDPDLRMLYLFLMGDKLPVEWAKKKRGFMPYNHQHTYFYFLLPPLLLPLYYHIEYIAHLIKYRVWTDIAWIGFFFGLLFLTFGPLLGGFGPFWLYMYVRFLESHWFVWVTQMNHIPMEVDYEQKRDWLSMQIVSTCNVEQSLFNDWFTGHLNFQIEHHLFPTMPRHNFIKIAPYVKALCKKHGLNYQTKTLMGAFADIVRSLKKSGQLWYDAYYHT